MSVRPPRPEMLIQLVSKVMECKTKAEDYYGVEIPVPKVSYMTGACGGMMVTDLLSNEHELRINTVLAEDNLEEYLTNVIPHEMAHLVTHVIYGNVQSHGREWKGVMSGCYGLRPSRTHNMDVSKVKRTTRKHRYMCGCREHMISTVMHNKISRGQTTRMCRHCRMIIQYVG